VVIDSSGVAMLGRIASMMVTSMGMQAENRKRESEGLSPAYGEQEFFELPQSFGCDETSLRDYLNWSQ